MSADLTKLSALAHLPVAPDKRAAALAALETFRSAAARLPVCRLADAEFGPGKPDTSTQPAAPRKQAREGAGDTSSSAGAGTGPTAAFSAVADTDPSPATLPVGLAAVPLESLRPDEPVPSFACESLLANAPAAKGGYISVPPVLDTPTEGDPA